MKTIAIVVRDTTLERAIEKRSKEIITKIRISKAINLQGAIENAIAILN